MNHLGPAATAFVDGELDHVRRDEVLAHLTWCSPCRAEVDALRLLKSTLRVEAPAVPFDLTSKLLAATEPLAPATRPALPARRGFPHVAVRPHLRRTAVGGAALALGLGGALSLAGPPPRGPVAPVDPTSNRFVQDHGATTSGEMPLTELDVVSVSRSLP